MSSPKERQMGNYFKMIWVQNLLGLTGPIGPIYNHDSLFYLLCKSINVFMQLWNVTAEWISLYFAQTISTDLKGHNVKIEIFYFKWLGKFRNIWYKKSCIISSTINENQKPLDNSFAKDVLWNCLDYHAISFYTTTKFVTRDRI